MHFCWTEVKTAFNLRLKSELTWRNATSVPYRTAIDTARNRIDNVNDLTASFAVRECKPGPFFLTPGFGFLQHQNPGPRGWLMTMQNLAFLEYTHHTSMARNRLRSKCAESTCRRTNRPRRCCSVSVRLTSDLLVTPGFDAVKTRNPGSEKNGPGLHSLLSN